MGRLSVYMKTLKKTIATLERKNSQQELNRFLRAYRTTPHSTTGKPPATAIFSRKVWTTLPRVQNTVPDKLMRAKDTQAKEKIKGHHDKHFCRPSPALKVGDYVLVKRLWPENKFQSVFHPDPFQVTAAKGTMITAQWGQAGGDEKHFTLQASIPHTWSNCYTGRGQQHAERDWAKWFCSQWWT